MNEEKIRAMIRQEIQASKSSGRFGLNATQRHVHNNIDSPYAFQPNIIYSGIVRSSGAASFLPKGWSSSFDAGGTDYTITHNLNIASTLYIVTASCLQSTNNGGGVVVTPFANSMTLTFVGGQPGDETLSKFATSFCFTLIIPNNNAASAPPTYVIS